MRNLIKYLCILAAFLPLPLVAQSTVDAAPVEVLPDHILRRIITDQPEQAINQLAENPQIPRGVLAGAKRWNIGAPISVCFFSGSAQLRARIAETASAWEKLGVPIRFDFGNRQDPNICRSNRYYDIRIGFTQPGYWSMIGQDSLIHVGQYEQSMNLNRFDYAPPPEPEFSRVVLHEFGHALGFTHEHQQESEGCEREFNWDAVYSYLSGPPNNWSRETIEFNLRSRKYMSGDISKTFDPKSIMLYTFPISFYNDGAKSKCYSPGNVSISKGDADLLRAAYGNDTAVARDKNTAVLTKAAQALPASERAGLVERLKFFNADQATKAQVMRQGNPKFTDVDINACSTTEATKKLVEEVTQFLNLEPRLGMLRYKGVGGSVTPGITILADSDHPEIVDANRLKRALSSRFNGQVKIAENPGTNRWLLNLVVCGAQ